tara:strand:- start:115 stop:468 length:354 start_codon:yes stop_codon:yes gene_type:complete
MNTMFKNNYFFLITLGAVPAAIFRWQIDETFIVNIIGCFLLGFINALAISKEYKLIYGFGFCGSLTTFGGWSAQLFKFISQGSYINFFLNSILIVIIGLLAVLLGDRLARKIKKLFQ